jgi:hypothetical protein
MYQPRRVSGPADGFDTLSEEHMPSRAAIRSLRPWRQAVGGHFGPILLGLTATATVGALALSSTANASPNPLASIDVSLRDASVSRGDAERPLMAVEEAMAVAASTADNTVILKPTRTMYAKKDLTVRAEPVSGADKVASLDVADKLTVTPEVDGAFRKVEYKGKDAWVLRAALVNSKPSLDEIADASAPAASRRVPSGSVLGLQPEAMVVYRAVMSRWDVPNVGGWRATSRSVHQFGRAIDFMTYHDTDLGYAIANFVAAHAKEFGVDHIIYRQRIWTPYNPTWRPMADRGSPTANHMDHVHVAVDAR